MPPWLAPNAVTLIGFAAVLVNFACVALVCPTLEGSESAGLWASCAAGLFFYQVRPPASLAFTSCLSARATS